MKKLLLLTLSIVASLSFGQEIKDSVKIDSVKSWSISGRNSLTFNQASFSNWIGGGSNNIGWKGSIDYDITYEKGDALWENIIILKYGQSKTQGFGVRKTDDVINLSTNYGTRITKSWYASAGASVLTQFSPGFEDGNNPDAKKLSSFMAPGYLNMGAGFTYRPNDDFTMTLRPANARWTFVLDEDLQVKNNYGLSEDGKSVIFQFGLMATVIHKLKVIENVSLLSTGSIFSNYLDHPEHLVLSYSGVLNMKVNKFMSAIATVDLIYDHNQIQKTQMKQSLGIGLVYHLKKGKVKSKTKYHRYWT